MLKPRLFSSLVLLSASLVSGTTLAGGDPTGKPPAATTPPAAAPAAETPTPKVVTSFSGMLAGRYDHSTTPGNSFNRLQDSIVFGFTITPAGVVDLVGMVQTGSKYGKRYATTIDLDDRSKDALSPTLYFKHLYLQKQFQIFGQATTTQAGVLGSEQKIGTQTAVGPTTAVGTNGWIEGARVMMETKAGAFSVTAGSISDVDQPEIQKRELSLNYVEVQMSRKVFDKISVEASGGQFDGEGFVRGAAEYDLQIVSEHIVKLVQEGFYSRNTFSYSTTASTDLGAFIAPKLAGRLNLDLRYSYIDPNAGFRGMAMNDLVLKGHVFSTALYGKVDRKGRLNWFAAKDFGDVTRFQTGMNWKFKGGNKK